MRGRGFQTRETKTQGRTALCAEHGVEALNGGRAVNCPPCCYSQVQPYNSFGSTDFTTNRSIDVFLPPYWLFWLKTPRLKHLLAFVTQHGSNVKNPLGSWPVFLGFKSLCSPLWMSTHSTVSSWPMSHEGTLGFPWQVAHSCLSLGSEGSVEGIEKGMRFLG